MQVMRRDTHQRCGRPTVNLEVVCSVVRQPLDSYTLMLDMGLWNKNGTWLYSHMFRFIHEKKIFTALQLFVRAYYTVCICMNLHIIFAWHVHFIFPWDVNRLFPLTIMHNNSMYFSAFLRRRVGACYPQGKHPQNLMAAPFVHVSHPKIVGMYK